MPRQLEINHNLRFHFHRSTIEHVGPVFPLLDRFDGGWGKQGMARSQSELLDVSVLVDQGLQNNLSLIPGPFPVIWILRLDFRYQQASRNP